MTPGRSQVPFLSVYLLYLYLLLLVLFFLQSISHAECFAGDLRIGYDFHCPGHKLVVRRNECRLDLILCEMGSLAPAEIPYRPVFPIQIRWNKEADQIITVAGGDFFENSMEKLDYLSCNTACSRQLIRASDTKQYGSLRIN